MTDDFLQPGQPCVGQLWRHYKGDSYRIALLGTDESSGEPAVAYQSLTTGRVWFRTLENFMSTAIDVVRREVPRFTRVEDSQ